MSGDWVQIVAEKDERRGQVGAVLDVERGRLGDYVSVAFDDGGDEVFLLNEVKKVEPPCKSK